MGCALLLACYPAAAWEYILAVDLLLDLVLKWNCNRCSAAFLIQRGTLACGGDSS
jgi:hypothetical protein